MIRKSFFRPVRYINKDTSPFYNPHLKETEGNAFFNEKQNSWLYQPNSPMPPHLQNEWFRVKRESIEFKQFKG